MGDVARRTLVAGKEEGREEEGVSDSSDKKGGELKLTASNERRTEAMKHSKIVGFLDEE